MVDRVYKKDLPMFRKHLDELREEFSHLGPGTDWVQLRIEPLLDHLTSLEGRSGSGAFSKEFSRLTRGMEMFHSDLVYFRTNLRGLEKILESERRVRARSGKDKGRNKG